MLQKVLIGSRYQLEDYVEREPVRYVTYCRSMYLENALGLRCQMI
jgi:hypothetical protein